MLSVMFFKEVLVQRVFKVLLILVFLVFTLIGGMFGANMGVNYSHVKLAFYTLAIPSLLILLMVYFQRFKTFKLNIKYLSISFSLLFYSSVIGGGYIHLTNSIGIHRKTLVSGPVILKEQNKGRYKPSFFITFKDIASNQLLEIELTSYLYNQLEVGDVYTETMYMGSLGLLYRQKT